MHTRFFHCSVICALPRTRLPACRFRLPTFAIPRMPDSRSAKGWQQRSGFLANELAACGRQKGPSAQWPLTCYARKERSGRRRMKISSPAVSLGGYRTGGNFIKFINTTSYPCSFAIAKSPTESAFSMPAGKRTRRLRISKNDCIKSPTWPPAEP